MAVTTPTSHPQAAHEALAWCAVLFSPLEPLLPPPVGGGLGWGPALAGGFFLQGRRLAPPRTPPTRRGGLGRQGPLQNRRPRLPRLRARPGRAGRRGRARAREGQR